MACADSTAYCGSGNEAAPAEVPALPTGLEASAGHTQREASHKRLSLQSWSLAQGTGSMWAHPDHEAHNAAQSAAQRAAKSDEPRAWRKPAGDGRDVLMAQG
jgi:hypothetical protein